MNKEPDATPTGYRKIITDNGNGTEIATLDNHYNVSYLSGNLLNGVTLGNIGGGTFSGPTNGVYTGTLNELHSGWEIDESNFTVGKTYLLRYKIQKTAGTLKNIAGHSASATQIAFRIDGQNSTIPYHLDDKLLNIADDTNEHIIEFKFVYNGNSSNVNIYIQPNRNYSDSVTVNLYDVELYEVVQETTKTYGTALGTLPTPARTGYTLDGWYTEASGGTQISASTTVADNDTKYYTHWQINTYAITYNLNGGSASGNPSTYNVQSQTITVNNPTKTGYTFLGWTGSNDLSSGITYTTSDPYTASSRDHYFGDEFAVTPGVTYRVFVTAKRTTGNLDMQGGIWYTEWEAYDGYRGAFTKVQDLDNGWSRYYKDVTVPSGKSAGKFYIQLEQRSPYGCTWLLADCSVIDTSTTATIPTGSTGDKSYTANWKEADYEIDYILNGGTNATGNPTSYRMSSATQTISVPTKTGYTFLGWSGSNDLSSGITYTTLAPYTASSRDHHFGDEFAVTPGVTYRVFVTAKRTAGSLDMQGGIWYTSYSSGTSYDGCSVKFTKIQDLDNGWARYYRDVTVPSGKQEGKFYIQVNQSASGGDTTWLLADGSVIDTSTTATIPTGSTGDKTFTANWTANTYAITYDNNYLENDTFGDRTIKPDNYRGNYLQRTVEIVDNQTAEHGKEIQITATADNSTNFAGIYVLANGDMTNGATYQWSVYLKASRNKTLYVGHHGQGGRIDITTEWKRFTGTFTANNTTNAMVFYQCFEYSDDTWTTGDKLYIHSLDLSQTDSRPITTVNKTYGTTLGTLSTPTRTGYTFQGWYTDPVGGTQISSSTAVPAGDTTYYAHWKVNTYTVVYNGNGNTGGSTASSTHICDVAQNLTENGFTRDRYTFKGWATTSTATTPTYTNAQSVKNLSTTDGATINLYAVWKDETAPTVTLAQSLDSTNKKATITLTTDVENKANESPWANNGAINTDVSSTEPGPASDSKTWKFEKTGTASQWNGWELMPSGLFPLNVNDRIIISGFYKTSAAANVPKLSVGSIAKPDWSGSYNVTVDDVDSKIVSDGKWHYFYCVMRANESIPSGILWDGPAWNYSSSAGILYINGLNWRMVPSSNTTATDIHIRKYASGSQTVDYFKNGNGTYFTKNSFEVTANGTYTVYAEDLAGNGTVKTITVSGIQ